jgi:hypothetical protein
MLSLMFRNGVSPEDQKEEMKKAAARAKKGGDFKDLAKRISMDAKIPVDRWITEGDMLPDRKMLETIWTLKAGEVSDVIVTRGGTTTCAKALHFKCPIVFNAFGGIMPQEQLTWKFFRNGAASEKVESGSDFAHLIDRWMSDAAAYPRVRENFLKLRYEENPTLLIEEVVGLANEVAGVKLKRLPFPPTNGNGYGHGFGAKAH